MVDARVERRLAAILAGDVTDYSISETNLRRNRHDKSTSLR
jgi:hypothetical protein